VKLKTISAVMRKKIMNNSTVLQKKNGREKVCKEKKED